MKTIIAGSRNYDNYPEFCDYMSNISWEITEVVSGAARGADAMGERWAKQVGLPCVKFPAQWDEWGTRAGAIRNSQMAEYADALVAFPAPGSKGTANMIIQANLHGLPVEVHEI